MENQISALKKIQQQNKMILEMVEQVFSKLEREATMQTHTDYLTKKEAAKLIKVSLGTITNYIDNGTLKASKFGSRVRLAKADVLSIASTITPKTKLNTH